MEIRVGENESLESALKRWKRKCARSGVLAEVRRREHYEKPSVKRKKKAEAARKRNYRAGQRDNVNKSACAAKPPVGTAAHGAFFCCPDARLRNAQRHGLQSRARLI